MIRLIGIIMLAAGAYFAGMSPDPFDAFAGAVLALVGASLAISFSKAL